MEYISRSNIAKMVGSTLVNASATDKCKKIISWSWEMLGSILIMMGSPISVKGLDFDDECKDKITAKRLKKSLLLCWTSMKPQYTLIWKELHFSMKKSLKILRQNQAFCQRFLKALSNYFELVIFTAAIKEYADKVIDYLDPSGFIKRRFYRDSCTKKDGVFYKDLTKVNSNLDKTFIIDNSLSGMSLNPQNGILIKSWYKDLKDQELKIYEAMLKKNVKPKDNIVKSISQMKRKYPKNVLN